MALDLILDFFRLYQDFLLTLPPLMKTFVNLFFLLLIIMAYSILVWKLHIFIAQKNIFKFDLNKYNTAEHPLLSKLIAAIFYFFEYIVTIPFIISFWYIIFTFFMILFIDENIPIQSILLISAIAIAAIRMASYIPNYGENLSKKIAEIFAFSFLAVSILDPRIFTKFLDRIIQRFSDISLFFSGLLDYLLFIVIIEIILRFFDLIFGIFGVQDSTTKQE